MVIGVLGARGKAGRYLVEELGAAGHSLRVLLHGPAPADFGPAVETLRGDATRPADLAALVRGCDAVVNAAGRPIAAEPFYCRVSAALVELLAGAPVRYIAVANAAVRGGGEAANPRLVLMRGAMRTLFRRFSDDRDRELALLCSSAADWTLLRLPAIANRPWAAAILAAENSLGGSFVSQRSIARFVVRELAERRFVRQAPFVWDRRRAPESAVPAPST